MSGVDEKLQLHLATDASKRCLGEVLFQLPGEPPGTAAEERHKHSLRIIMFMSFKLEEAETRYHTTEREALAVVRCMAEAKCFIMGHEHPTMLYTDHIALESIMRAGTDAHERIARWMDRLTEYDYVVHHRPCKANIMGLADEMSRMPGRYSQVAVAEDSERITMVVAFPTGKKGMTLPAMQSHQQYRESKWYGKVANYLLDGATAVKNCGRSEAKTVRQMSLRYKLTDQHLLYTERSGEFARCLLPQDIPRILTWAHDEHGHFSIVITLHKLRGQWYWPTRTTDVERHCRSCHVCQLNEPRKKSTIVQPILKFHPFAMLGMDFLDPISPRYQATGAAYVLVVIDYFSRFVWAKACVSADQEAVHDFWINTLAPIFGFPKDLYTDNGSHFIDSETISLFESHGTHVTQAPISHPSSVGLVERNVQIVLAQIRRWVYQKGPTAKHYWGRAIPQIMPNINGRLLRVHGFTPAEILLRYNPKWKIGDENRQESINDQVDVSITQGDLAY